VIFAHFTERPYRWLPEEEVIRNQSFFGVPNRFFDREKAADDYNYYLDEMLYAEQLGFDAIVLNEHHGTPFCMGSVMNVEAAILARITRRARIVLLGNPLPVIKHPLRMAEELAEIDLISRGRLVTGWVRGAGSEQFFNNANPAYNREYFNEAHDFIVKAWTTPGPFRYEGKHFHYRMVNPWVLPYQKPHPPFWIPGVLSPETVLWCAQKRYPYIGLGTALGPTADLWDLYADAASEEGYQAGSENFGYLQPVAVAETEEKAHEIAQGFLWGGGQTNFSRPEWTLPPGYNSKAATRRLARSPGGSWLGLSAEKLAEQRSRSRAAAGELSLEEARRKIYSSYPKARKNLSIVAGTPKTVIAELGKILEVLRPGVLALFQVQGPISNQDRMTSVRLQGEEVVPALREKARQLGLLDPFERAPGSRPLARDTKREPVNSRDALAKLMLEP